MISLVKSESAFFFYHENDYCATFFFKAEREANERKIEEKHSKSLLRNTLDPLLSRLTKVSSLICGFCSWRYEFPKSANAVNLLAWQNTNRSVAVK